MSSSFQNLNHLVIEGCDNLKELFPSSMVNRFVQLQYLEISSCSLLEEVVFMEELKEEERKDTQFPFLKEMVIRYCPNFKGFISNDKIGFPSLKEMKMLNCPKLKEFIFNDKVAVPNLEKLTIWCLYDLEKIWHNQLVKDSFCKLKSLKVGLCNKLLNVFPSNICGRLLSSLESLKVSYCNSLEEIFDFRELSIYDSQIMLSFASLQQLKVSWCGSLKNLFSASILAKEGVVMEEAPARFLFPKLTSLELDDLRELRSFYSSRHKVEGPVLKKLELFKCGIDDTDEDDEEGQMQQPLVCSSVEEIGFPSLKEMEIMNCPELKEFIFNDKVAVPNLEKLTIWRMYNLEKIWHNQLVKDSFCKLKSLKVDNCRKLLNVFPSNICGRLLSSLVSLEVGDCDSLEEIFDLRELSIYDSQIILSFESLQRLEVSGCQSLKNLFFASILANEGVVMEEAPARFLFPKLTSLQLFDLLQLRSFYQGRHKVEGPVLKTKCIHDIDEEGQMQQPFFSSWVEEIGFPSLKEMEITSCPELKEFIFNDKVAVPNLEKLTIWGMDNLEKIWHNQLVKDSFCKLKSLKVDRCRKLLNVFLSNICGRLLSSLVSLEVRDCDSLEEIFDLRELSIYDSQIMLSFESLQKLEVSRCQSLKNLFSASILAKERVVMEEAPARTSLRLSSLPELRSFYPGRHKVEGPVLKTKGIHDIDEEGQMQQPFVCSSVEEVAAPNLEKLTIWGMDNLEKIWHDQLVKDSFCKLKSLKVYGCKKLLNVFPSNICERLLSLESLEVSSCPSLEEIFDLREFSIYDSQIMLFFESLQRLEVLKVEGCDSLINLMPPPTSFQNPSTSFQHLTSLTVSYCDSLINIGTSSVAKSLVQLTEMSISSCEKITEVIGYHGDVIEDEIIFRKLKSLWLQSLPSLISFCSWNFTLKFPSLETLSVEQCPNMKIFSQGDLTTEKLQEVKIDLVSIELHPDFNLNTTIQQSHKKAISAKDNGASSSRHLN